MRREDAAEEAKRQAKRRLAPFRKGASRLDKPFFS
jgi:hypothetical protein